MGDVWSETQLLAAADFWAWYEPNPPDTAQLDYVLTVPREAGSPATVQASRIPPAQVGARIAQVTERVRLLGRPGVRWWVRPSTTPADMGAQLERHGFRRSLDLEILSWDLGRGGDPALPTFPPAPEVTTELVQDEAGLRLWHQLSAAGFEQLPLSDAALAGHITALGEAVATGERSTFTLVARLAGTPVASAGFTVIGSVARFGGASTLPAYRGRGVYGALVLARCHAAHARGAELVLTKARVDTSGPLLRRAGFRMHGHDCCYEQVLRES